MGQYLWPYGGEPNQEAIQTLFGSGLRYVIMFAPLAFVLALSFGIQRMSYPVASVVFGLYSLVMGISLSAIFIVYSGQSIFLTFFVTAGTFLLMAIVGFTTKMDLTKLRPYLMFALFGIIIAMLVNMFIGSSTMDLVISGIGVVLFMGLTAYDVQRLSQMDYMMGINDSEEAKKVSIMGALSLYLNFINLFLFLLRFLGSSRD